MRLAVAALVLLGALACVSASPKGDANEVNQNMRITQIGSGNTAIEDRASQAAFINQGKGNKINQDITTYTRASAIEVNAGAKGKKFGGRKMLAGNTPAFQPDVGVKSNVGVQVQPNRNGVSTNIYAVPQV
ncbi:hypothetical protein MNEG_15971 [Monoraphidium neglectum]|uniref:Uncharacterized protein n=1 Tax=Monoraphidium neglectum TaxID=145388 RepID=A0A0D2IVM5_9CHLO|nr:hypothetical protein MNEG_15971 [Monoraphidium neglectum]KIY91992.1 hypothetical protein MNEG_15971 [Monoraphidium neglectum]|eukprot:XP_013891012.1 hypothetical protein MNEG_15971 [Monoraphidium neglectum]